MTASISDSLPEHWKYVSEGGATIVYSYTGPPNTQFNGTVLRLRKSKDTTSAPIKDNQDEPDDPTIEYQDKCMQRLIPLEHLPRLESVRVHRQWLEELVALHDADRPEARRQKDQVDLTRTKGVLATDLVGGDWLAVEIKILHAFGNENLYSGDELRVRKAVNDLWGAWADSNGMVNNLKIFVQGKTITPDQAHLIMAVLGTESGMDGIREGFVSALLPTLLNTSVLHTLSNLQRTLDVLDIEGLSQLWRQAETSNPLYRAKFGSSLEQTSSGNTSIPTPCLPFGVSSDSIAFKEPTIDDWTEFLDIYTADTQIDHTNPTPENLRYYLLAYLLSATFKDCSIIVRLDRLRHTATAQGIQPGQINVIDLDLKNIERLRKWEKIDQEIVNTYTLANARKTCIDAWR
ncbi:hypothetical protein H0H81_003448 [Sphagnurus paluster]|uniref:Inositol-pentakisphosphate 2-kinase n=1 Tax=Sphagnurus paluster TaxID=117069 RepID=A0A9P7FRJ6_9AGAR|nr:hypothetical protein H0H81_003448 [Sphagnurus paluster]